jgi:competence protein ComEA
MGEWLEKYRGNLFFAVMVLAISGVILVRVRRPEPQPIELSTATPLPSPEATPTVCPLRVYVSGAVHQPDVYTLPPDSIVKDAILAAGGATDDADLDRINLALAIADGQHVYVPHLGEESPPVEPPSAQTAPGGKVNINTADLKTLESLPGIGPVMAQRILDYRQAHGLFAKIEDVMEVSGIGPSTFENMRELITTK